MTQIGKIIAGYKIRMEVGKGGMGVVFRAEHPVLGDRPPVAIKMLNSHLVQESDIKKRFRREAQLQEQLKHECIVELKVINNFNPFFSDSFRRPVKNPS